MPFGRPCSFRPRCLCGLSAFAAGLGLVAWCALLEAALRAAAPADGPQVLDAVIVAAVDVVGVAGEAVAADVAVVAVELAGQLAQICPVGREPFAAR